MDQTIIRVHDASTGAKLAEFTEEGIRIGKAEVSSDDRYLLAFPYPAQKAPLVLWDLATRKEVYREPSAAWTAACFSPDGKHVVICGYEKYPRLVECATGKVVRSFEAPWVRHAAFSPDGGTLAIGHLSTITLWDVATGRLLPSSAQPKLEIQAIRFSVDGQRLLGTAENVIAWDPRTGKELRRFPNPPHNHGRFVILSPDESLLAGRSLLDHKLYLCDAATGKQRVVLEPGGNTVELRFTPDSRRLITSGVDGIRVWDARTGHVVYRLTRGTGAWGRWISPDGKWLAANTSGTLGRGEGTLRLWDLGTGEETSKLSVPGDGVGSVAFSHDGRWMATSSPVYDRGSHNVLWQLATRKLSHKWDGSPKPTSGLKAVIWSSLAFSPDDRTLASGGDDGVLRFREVATGKERHHIKGHQGPIGGVVFSPDGKWLAAVSEEAPVYVWDIWAGLPAAQKLSPQDLQRCYTDLAGDDAVAAFAAIRLLSTAPEQALPLLRERLKRVVAPDPVRVQRLIADLDSKKFNERQKATTELERLGDAAAHLLEQAVPKASSVETRRRLENLLVHLDVASSESIRTIRAVETLEWMRTAEAQRLLEDLAQGAPGALLTREAIKARDRMQQTAKSSP